MKIALQTSTEPSETDIKFIQQLGIDQVVLWTDASKSSAEYYASRKKLYADAGINVFGFGNSSVHNQEALVLNLEGRDAKVEEYKNHLRSLGKAGIHYTTYAHMGNGIWSTSRELTRGGSSAGAYDQTKVATGSWGGKRYQEPLSNGRKYTTVEVWANYEYFIKQAAAVAEEQKVNIGIHPNDPPPPITHGSAQIMGDLKGWKRLIEIVDSPSNGITFDCGVTNEIGEDRIEVVRYFGSRDRINHQHFRNSNMQVPREKYVEQFVDEGDVNMFAVMQELVRLKYKFGLFPEHPHGLDADKELGGDYIGYVFNAAYAKAMLQAVLSI